MKNTQDLYNIQEVLKNIPADLSILPVHYADCLHRKELLLKVKLRISITAANELKSADGWAFHLNEGDACSACTFKK